MQTRRHDEASTCFSQFCERSYKRVNNILKDDPYLPENIAE